MKRVAILAFVTALASPAFADDTPRTEVTFEDPDDVRGEAPQPLESFNTSRRRHGRETLIRPRFHFRPELLKSIEDI